MGFAELLVLAVGLSMDAFSVSVCKGLSMKEANIKAMMICGIWFGGFQALMPLLGFLLGSLLAELIVAIDHWIAFVLLAIIGLNMLKEAFSKEKDESEKNAELSAKIMFTMALATSIDALAAGISLSMAGNTNIWIAITLIGVTTFILSAVGVKAGCIFGSKFEKKAQAAGGFMLIFLGVKILIEHLGLL